MNARDHLRRGRDLRWEKRLDEAEAAFQEALARSRDSADPDYETEADALVWLSVVRIARAGCPGGTVFEDALRLQSEALAIERAHNAGPRRIAETQRALGATLYRLGRLEDASRELQEAVDAFAALSVNNASSREALMEMIDLFLDMDRPDASEKAARELVRLQEEAEDRVGPRERVMGLYRLGRALTRGGRRTEARAVFASALTFASKLAPPAARLIEELRMSLENVKKDEPDAF